MGLPENKPSAILPKINKQLQHRSLALVVVVGACVVALAWYMKVQQDLKGLEKSDTVNYISAIQYLPQGQQAVLIAPDGKIVKDPGYVSGSSDRDTAWSPHGNFLYFTSDRKDHTFNLYRWSPDSKDAPEERTTGTRSRGDLVFPVGTNEDSDSVAKGLIVTGGIVQEFDPHSGATAQILPPSTNKIAQGGGEEQGTEGQFEGVYGQLGTSFREAQWCGGPGRHHIAAVMRRDAGEILVEQDMDLVDGKFPEPKPIIAGDHIDFAINPKTGAIIYTVQGYQWPTGAPPQGPDGKPVKKPFQNAVVTYDVTSTQTLIIGANGGEQAFSQPSISPDGSQMVVIMAKVDKGDMTPLGMITLPTTNDRNYKRHQVSGDYHEPSWSPDGSKILLAVRVPGKSRTIFELPLDGSPPRNVTGDAGNFGFPHYSPQTKDAKS